MSHVSRFAFALAAAAFVAPAFAATPINQTRPLDADGSVSIGNVAGSITVRTWDQPQVKITGSLGDGVEKLIVEGDARSLRIEVKYPEDNNGMFGWGSGKRTAPSTLEVTLPRKASVDVEAVSASVDVQGVFGRRLGVESVSGRVDVSRSAPGEGEFQAVSGDLELWLDTANLSVSSVSGDVNAHGALTGEIELESVSGHIELAARKVRRLEVSTVSADAILSLALADGARLDAESVSGDVRISLPASASARLSLESFSGDIDSPVGRVEREEYGPGSSLDARLGGGSAQVQIETLSGDIEIRTGETTRDVD
jgi:DUF4097 and DUF4098 domain-containing protein YvlB